jgi:hypothetical protein
MTRLAITALLLTWICGAPIAAAAQSGPPGAAATQFRVAVGDTLLNLFGDDWRKVYDLNRCGCRFSPFISDANDPNFMYAGSSLTVPTDVHLTERALGRLTFLKRERDNLRGRLGALMQAGGDVAASADHLHGALDAPLSVDDLAGLDDETSALEHAEVQSAIEEDAQMRLVIGGAVLALFIAMLLAWAWRNHADGASRRLRGALRMIDSLGK